MRFIVLLLLQICKVSTTYPRSMMVVWALLSFAGFASMPFITISSNIMSGVGSGNAVINLTMENNSIFGEQDSLIAVVEFPEPPGEARLPFVRALGEAIAQLPDVRQSRYRMLDPEDKEQTSRVFKNFLLGMNDREREGIHKIFSVQGITDALRRTRNRLFLAGNPYIQERLIEDPLEVGQFVARSMEKRLGSVNLGDVYLLIASPDSTVYLIQVTPAFTSADLVRGATLVERMRQLIPQKIAELKESNPDLKTVPGDIRWYLTGKTVFQYESDVIFDRETLTIVACSFLLVLALLFSVYRSGWSAMILMTPLVAGIGPNYAVIHVSYPEVNPVVMGATGVLLGLGAEYGEHLWGRIREELDRGRSRYEALQKSYAETGPPVLLGGLTGTLAFLCLCLSDQPALAQFGFFGAVGLVLTMLSTLFLLPAIFTVVASREKDYFPVVKVNFGVFSRLFEHHPKTIVLVSGFIFLISLGFVTRVSYEKDLFKVFLARHMDSMAVSERISRKFRSNFSQPTLLSFDTEDLQTGLSVQRELDGILEHLMEGDHEIASFDSISYLMSPDAIKEANVRALADTVASWPKLEKNLKGWLAGSDLASRATNTMEQAFDITGNILRELETNGGTSSSDATELEKSWYMTKFRGKYRFLTRIRYADTIADPDQLKQADKKLLGAVETLPVPIRISGTRQAMEAVLSSLISELVKLGLYAFASVVLVFFIVFPHPLGVGLCLIPMIGAFSITLGATGATGMGVPFSIVCVAPLIFGFGIHNGIHVVMGSLHEEGGSVARTVTRVTPRAMVTSLTITMGFVAMLTSQHYPMQFLGGTMVIGMMAAVPLTLVTLPSILILIERRRQAQTPS